MLMYVSEITLYYDQVNRWILYFLVIVLDSRGIYSLVSYTVVPLSRL